MSTAKAAVLTGYNQPLEIREYPIHAYWGPAKP